MRIWKEPFSDDIKVRFYMDTLKLSYISASIVYNRFQDNAKEATKYFMDNRYKMPDPMDIEDMGKGVKHILKSIEYKAPILIWGDEDGDGITATAILYKTLQLIGADVKWFIPVRDKYGIGINLKKAREICKQNNIKLLITVDCGSRNIKEVQELFYNDIDVIITDHHIPGNQKPGAVAFINPKKDKEENEFYYLSGSGISYLLSLGLIKEKMKISVEEAEKELEFLLPFAVIGTISDRVPLSPLNRYILKKGIEYINNTGKHGIWEHINTEKICTTDIRKEIIPVINSARGDTPNKGVIMLLNNGKKEAEDIYNELKNRSQSWQKSLDEQFNIIKEKIKVDNGIIVLYEENLKPSFIGTIASKIVDEYSYPAVVMTNKEQGIIIGEARSPENVDILSILEGCRDRFIDYGGHKQACGFSAKQIMRVDIEKLLISVFASKYPNYSPPPLQIDTIIPSSTLNSIQFWDIHKLSPFGDGFPYPTIQIKNAKITNKNDTFYINGVVKIEIKHPQDVPLDQEMDILVKVDEKYNFTLIDIHPNQ